MVNLLFNESLKDYFTSILRMFKYLKIYLFNEVLTKKNQESTHILLVLQNKVNYKNCEKLISKKIINIKHKTKLHNYKFFEFDNPM